MNRRGRGEAPGGDAPEASKTVEVPLRAAKTTYRLHTASGPGDQLTGGAS